MNSKSLSKALISKGIGEEPFFDVEPTGSQMLDAYSYYSKVCKLKDAKKFLIAYVDKLNEEEYRWSKQYIHEDLLTALERSDYTDVSATSGWVAKLLLNGSKVHPASETFMWNNIFALVKKTKKKGLDVPKERKSNKESDKQKALDILEKFNNLNSDQMLNYLKKNNIPTRLIKYFIDYANEKNAELNAIFNGKDKTSLELKEKSKEKIVFFGDLLIAINEYQTFKKSIRKPRKKKNGN